MAMILRFPCMTRQNVSIPGQRHLSDYGQGVSFADMTDHQLERYERGILAQNEDIAWVDQSYPGIRDVVSA